MGANGLDPDITKDSSIVSPSPLAVSERAEVDDHARARIGEEVVEMNAVRAIRLLREELAPDRDRELARRRSVLRPDDAIRHEGPLERQTRVPTARDRVIPVADAVVDGPDAQERDSGEDEDRRRNEPCPPGSTHEQRDHRQHEQHLIARPHEHEEGDAQPYEREASRRR